jgi:preprotein translocase subunit SecF
MTSLTVAVTLMVLFFFGGEVIHDFAFAMLWGSLSDPTRHFSWLHLIIYEWQARRKSCSDPVPARFPV